MPRIDTKTYKVRLLVIISQCCIAEIIIPLGISSKLNPSIVFLSLLLQTRQIAIFFQSWSWIYNRWTQARIHIWEIAPFKVAFTFPLTRGVVNYFSTVFRVWCYRYPSKLSDTSLDNVRFERQWGHKFLRRLWNCRCLFGSLELTTTKKFRKKISA